MLLIRWLKIKLMTEPIFSKMSVKLIGTYGCDLLISEVAGISTEIKNKNDRHIEKRIKFIIDNGHDALEEFGDLHFEIKAPLFTALQWVRHRMSSFNMQSGRRTKMFKFYIPNGREDVSKKACEIIKSHCYECIETYDKLIELKTPLEIARVVLPQNIMTKFHYKANLRSILNFLKLRNDLHAQWEIQQLAKEIEKEVKRKFPLVYKYWSIKNR